MHRSLPLVLLASCSFTGNNHRPVGAIDASIADASTLTRLELRNVAGAVEVTVADQVGARVDVEVLLADSRPESDFEPRFAKHVEMVRNGGTLTIRSLHADQSDNNDWQLRYRIRVPAGIALAIDQVAGTVDLRLPRTGDVTINNVAGTVTMVVPTVEGKVTASAQSGTIDITIADRGPVGGCRLDCTTGTIALRLPKDTKGEFKLGAVTGSIDVASRYGFDTRRSVASVSASGTVGAGGPEFRAHVVTGTVELR